jgi:hypothetical protein
MEKWVQKHTQLVDLERDVCWSMKNPGVERHRMTIAFAAISIYHFTLHFLSQEEVQRNVVLRQSTPEAELQRRGLCLLKLTVYCHFRMSGIELKDT